ncbi:MAG TPA: hypothetical protein VK644_08750 [Chitinophagaceae bacterium]|nr:hypothetical protein [Chitinophagaceae bacterium]
MNTYRLLRSNKESGPFSLEELVGQGIKPYDLVWVTGRSAAWRYPSEVEELRPYAPAVEDQPYDRFYKKPAMTEEKKEALTVAENKIADTAKVVPMEVKQAAAMESYQPKIAAEHQQFMPRKSVFVTLPGQPKASAEKKVYTEMKTANPDPVPSSQTISISENPVAKINYSQPLDDIKEMYVKTLQERKSRIARKGFLLKNLKIAGVVLGLVGIGVLAGFIIKPNRVRESATLNKPSQAITAASEKILPQEIDSTSNPKADVAVRDQSPAVGQAAPVNDVNEEKIKEDRQVVNPPAEDRVATGDPVVKKEARKEKPAEASDANAEQNKEKQFYLGAEKNPISGERTRTVRDNNNGNLPANSTLEPADKPVARSKNPVYDQVVVTSNDYKKVAFGGIRDLRLTVTNNSNTALDNVIVELQYLKPSEETLRTENILFRSIAANESSTIRVPDTNRGIKVLFKVVSIGK